MSQNNIEKSLIFAKTSLYNIVLRFRILLNLYSICLYLGQFVATYLNSPSYTNVAKIFIVQPLPNYVVITKHDVNYNDKIRLNNNITAIL